MRAPMWGAPLTVQQATPRPATTSQNPAPTTDRDLQNAAQELREAVRNNIQQQIDAARAKADAQAGAQGAGGAIGIPVPPVPPAGTRRFTFRGPDGTQIIEVPPRAFDNLIPPQVVDISIAFFLTMAAIIIGLPLARAFARRMDRRGGPGHVPAEISSQLAQLNQAVDAIALEVERISEGQRYTTRLLSEQRDAPGQTLPSGVNR
ncbi:MAG: hypothetical protein ACJ785_13420 [Gemmatimonadaceae bacterium]